MKGLFFMKISYKKFDAQRLDFRSLEMPGGRNLYILILKIEYKHNINTNVEKK